MVARTGQPRRSFRTQESGSDRLLCRDRRDHHSDCVGHGVVSVHDWQDHHRSWRRRVVGCRSPLPIRNGTERDSRFSRELVSATTFAHVDDTDTSIDSYRSRHIK